MGSAGVDSFGKGFSKGLPAGAESGSGLVPGVVLPAVRAVPGVPLVPRFRVDRPAAPKLGGCGPLRPDGAERLWDARPWDATPWLVWPPNTPWLPGD
nr:hypothetical protein Ade03nite_12060 [Actinoplanes derwentensis]